MSHQHTTENPTPQFASPQEARAQAKAEKAYRRATRPWFKKKRFWLLGIVALFIIIGIASTAGGGDDPNAGTENAPAGNAAPIEADTTEAADAAEGPAAEAEPVFPGAQDSDVVGQAGDELAFGDVAITAGALVAGDATFGETLCSNVSLGNNSDQTIDFTMFDWKLQDPNGTILNTGLTGSEDQISTGQIAPGGNTSGDVCFDADTAASGQYVLLYEPFFADRGAWINER